MRTDRVPNLKGFVGGSDARILMGNAEAALLRLWREKRGEVEPAAGRSVGTIEP